MEKLSEEYGIEFLYRDFRVGFRERTSKGKGNWNYICKNIVDAYFLRKIDIVSKLREINYKREWMYMIKYLEKNKLYVIVKLIISIFFATTITIDRIFVYSKNIFAGIDKNYLTNIELKRYLYWNSSVFCSYIAISLIEIIVNKIEDIVYVKRRKKRKEHKSIFCIFL